MSEPKGHQQRYDPSVALDLTFLRMTGGNADRNVKSATLAAHGSVTYLPEPKRTAESRAALDRVARGRYGFLPFRRGGRVAEGGGLLNRYTV